MVDLKCAICGEKALGVACSPMGAMSRAICGACITANRVTWGELVGGLYGCMKDDVADWAKPFIEATCEYYNKTEDDLWKELVTLEEEYEKYMKGQSENEDCTIG